MAHVSIGIGECKVSNDAEDVLITHALGSCIAVMVHDPLAKIAGLLHYMLPEAGPHGERAGLRPYVYADTGIPLLLQTVYKMGASKSRMMVSAAGGAQMSDPNGTFNIGKRNHLALRKIFWKAGVIVHKEDIGGTSSRTVRINVGSGRVQVKTTGVGERDLVAATKKWSE